MTHPTPLRSTETASRETRALPFKDLLPLIRERRGVSQGEMGRRAGLTKGHASRLEDGSRNPTRETVNALADALGLHDYDRDALMVAAGYVPSDPLHILVDEPVIGRLASVLADPTIPADVRDGIREMLWQVVRIVPREVAS